MNNIPSLDQELYRPIISLKESCTTKFGCDATEHTLCMSRIRDFIILLETEYRSRFTVRVCVSKSAQSIHLQILKPHATDKKDKLLSKQFKEQLKMIACNSSLGTCIPDILVPVGLDGLHIVLQRVKDESGLVVNIMIDKAVDPSAYDYSDEALEAAVGCNLARIDEFYYMEGINEWVDYIACAVISLFRAKKSRIWRLGHVGRWQIRVMVYAFLKIYPYVGFTSFSIKNMGRTLIDFLFFFGWVFDPREVEFELSRGKEGAECFLVEKKRKANDDITINWIEKGTIFNIGPGCDIKELFQDEYRGFLEDYRSILKGELSDKSHFFKSSATVSEEEYKEMELRAAKNAASMLKVKEIKKCFLDGNNQLLYTLTYKEYPGKIMHVHHAKFPDPDALKMYWSEVPHPYERHRPKEYPTEASESLQKSNYI